MSNKNEGLPPLSQRTFSRDMMRTPSIYTDLIIDDEDEAGSFDSGQPSPVLSKDFISVHPPPISSYFNYSKPLPATQPPTKVLASEINQARYLNASFDVSDSGAVPEFMSPLLEGPPTPRDATDDGTSKRPKTKSINAFTNSFIEMLNYSPKPRQPGSKKSSLHFRRHRCCYLSLVISILVLIVIGLSLYFGLSGLAQSFVDGSQVTFTRIQIAQPRQDSFLAKIEGRISNAGPFNAQTSEMRTHVSYDGKSLGFIVMPAMSLQMGAADFEIEAPFEIDDITGFQMFSTTLMQDAGFVWQLQGQFDLTVMGQSLKGIRFDKRVYLAGMNGFQDIKIDNFTLATPPNSNQMQMDVQASMTNPSVVTVDLGNVTFDMLFEGVKIGQVTSQGVQIKPGLNRIYMTGSLVGSSPQSTDKISTLFSNYVAGNTSDIQVVGTGVQLDASNKSSSLEVKDEYVFSSAEDGFRLLSDNSSTVVWLDDAVKNMKLNVPLDRKDADRNPSLVTSVSMNGMFLQFPEPLEGNSTSPDPLLSAKAITVNFDLPFDISMNVTRNRLWVSVYDGSDILGQIETGWFPASNNDDPKQIKTYLPQVPLQLARPNEGGPNGYFPGFLTSLFRSRSGQFRMKGYADVEAQTVLGKLVLHKVEFEQTIAVDGMQTLLPFKQDGRSSNPIIKKVRVKKGFQDTLFMETDIVLYSPASMGANLGDIRLDLYLVEPDLKIGHTILRNLTVNPDDNFVTCQTYLHPESDEVKKAVDNMISDYVNGKSTMIRMRGTKNNSTRNYIIADSISYLDLKAPMKGMDTRLVQSADMKLNVLTAAFDHEGKTRFRTANPFDDSFGFSKMKASVKFNNEQLAAMDVDLTQHPLDGNVSKIVVAPGQTIDIPYLPVSMDNPLSKDSMTALRKGLSGSLLVNVDAQIDSYLGDFQANIHYVQSNVSATISVL